MVTPANLRQLIQVMDARLALLGPARGDEDEAVTLARAEIERRRVFYEAELAALSRPSRLPYRDGE